MLHFYRKGVCVARNEPIYLPHFDQPFSHESEEDFHLCFPEAVLNSDCKNCDFVWDFMIFSWFVAVCGNHVRVPNKIKN